MTMDSDRRGALYGAELRTVLPFSTWEALFSPAGQGGEPLVFREPWLFWEPSRGSAHEPVPCQL
jgi:hypothetical protein